MTETKRREIERAASADVKNGFFPSQNPYNFVREREAFMHYLMYGFDCPKDSEKKIEKKIDSMNVSV